MPQTVGSFLKQKRIVIIANYVMAGLAFIPAFQWMGDRFNEPESSYSHGFLIPFVVAYLLWEKRKSIFETPVTHSPAGIILLAAGLVIHLFAGVILGIGIASGVSFILVLFGLFLALFGPVATKKAAVPLAFIMLMVPIPQVFIIALTFKLKMIAAYIAGGLISLTKIQAYRAGGIFHIPEGSLIVENECSGINSLISLVTLAVILAYTVKGSIAKKAVVVAAAVPVTILANAVRIAFLVLVAYVYGIKAAREGILHYGAGFLLWGVALMLFFGMWKLITWKNEP